MSERYWVGDVKDPMLHLAERNLLLAVFRDRLKSYYGEGKIEQKNLCEVKITLRRHWDDREGNTTAFVMTMQNEENVAGFYKQLVRRYRIEARGGWIIPIMCVRSVAELSGTEVDLLKCLVADVAETLKLLANGDCFMKIGVEKLIAKIASETDTQDPTVWVREYLEPPKYMQRPEVRRYYRFCKYCLNNAMPQLLLYRKPEELIEELCRGGVPT